MNIRILPVMTFIFLIAFSAYSAVVYVDPASQDSPAVGDAINFNINVKDVIDLAAYQIEVSFNKDTLKLTSIEEGNFLKTGFGNDTEKEGTIPFIITTVTEPPKSIAFDSITPSVYSDINSLGKMVVANSRYSINELKGVDGAGNLLKLKFEVLASKSSNIQLNAPFDDPNLILVNSKLGVIESQLSGAVINEPQTCLKGDVFKDGVINSKDATLTKQIIVGMVENPTTWQLCAADITEDSKIDARDAIKILQISAGLGAPIMQSINHNITASVSLGEIYSLSGKDINVPLLITQAEMIAGGDITITYDPSVLRAFGVVSDNYMPFVANTKKAGIIKISFADSVGAKGDISAEIKFNVISDKSSSISLNQVALYRNDLSPVTFKKKDGWFASWAIPARDDALLQNYPNPFNPETWIPFQLKQNSDVSIKIYSTTGELVRELDLGNKSAGVYVSQDRAAYWDGKDKFGVPVSSGIYFYSIKTKDFSDVRKLIIIK